MSEQNVYFQEEEKELKHLDSVKCLKPKQKWPRLCQTGPIYPWVMAPTLLDAGVNNILFWAGNENKQSWIADQSFSKFGNAELKVVLSVSKIFPTDRLIREKMCRVKDDYCQLLISGGSLYTLSMSKTSGPMREKLFLQYKHVVYVNVNQLFSFQPLLSFSKTRPCSKKNIDTMHDWKKELRPWNMASKGRMIICLNSGGAGSL